MMVFFIQAGVFASLTVENPNIHIPVFRMRLHVAMPGFFISFPTLY